jgi:hypothetical protein
MKTILLSLFFLVTMGCSDSNNERTFTSQDIIPIVIAKGHLGNNMIYSQQNTIISTAAEWQILLENFNTINTNITETFSTTEIDLSNFDIILAIQTRNSTTTVDVTTIVENADCITVTVENLQLGISQDVVHPFHIVKIPKSTKPIVFQIN